MPPPAWPMYMPGYLPRPVTHSPFLKAQFEELARRDQEMVVRELEVQCMSRSLNLEAVRKTKFKPATSTRGNSQLASRRSPPTGIEEVSQTVAPPTPSQDGASQDTRTVVQSGTKTSLTQFGVIPQESPVQSQAPSGTREEPPQLEDISSEGELPDTDSDQEAHSGTPVLDELLMG